MLRNSTPDRPDRSMPLVSPSPKTKRSDRGSRRDWRALPALLRSLNAPVWCERAVGAMGGPTGAAV